MSLDQGGHLTHGSPVNFSGRLYRFLSYGLDPKTETIDYDGLERLAREERPKLIVGGASAYPRVIDFERLAAIAHGVGAKLMIDMAHIAGLVATGAHPSPFPHADVVTSTTHKTLRGPRGGLILTNDDALAKAIDKAVLPRYAGRPAHARDRGQGGRVRRGAAAGVRSLHRACGGERRGVGRGARRGRPAPRVRRHGQPPLPRGPHGVGRDGRDAERLLDSVGLTVNKNAIPGEPRSPFVTSGIRVGSAAGTTRGFTADEFREIGWLIARAVFGKDDEAELAAIRARTAELLAAHPLYPEL